MMIVSRESTVFLYLSYSHESKQSFLSRINCKSRREARDECLASCVCVCRAESIHPSCTLPKICS